MVALRINWDIDEQDTVISADEQHEFDGRAILKLIDNNSLTVHFQTIFSASDGAVYGYEALTRIKEHRTERTQSTEHRIQTGKKEPINPKPNTQHLFLITQNLQPTT